MKPCIVLQSDFGLSTGLPASMTAVIVKTDPEIRSTISVTKSENMT